MNVNSKVLRYERKFNVHGLSVHQVEQIIKTNTLCFDEIYHSRYINNIYFDTFERRSWHENVDGDTSRVKTRIRWYDTIFGIIKSPVLEYKIKQGLLGKKQSYKLPAFFFDSTISKRVLYDIFKMSELPKEVIYNLLSLEPTLVNRYKRKYFMSKNMKFRITLDNELLYYKIKSSNNHFHRANEEDMNVVVEIKYSKEDDKYVNEISNQFPFRLTKKSKYVSGIYQTNY